MNWFYFLWITEFSLSLLQRCLIPLNLVFKRSRLNSVR